MGQAISVSRGVFTGVTMGSVSSVPGTAPSRLWSVRARRRLLAVAVAAFAALWAVPASAHTELVSSDPPDGSGVAAAPSQIDLHFTRTVAPLLAVVSLSDAAGRPVTGIDKHVDPGNSTVLVVSFPKLRPDAYRLSYSVLDQVDLHRTTGSVVFGVGGRPGLASESATAYGPGLADASLRLVDRGALAVLLGVLLMVVVVLPRGAHRMPLLSRLSPRLLRIAAWSVAAMAVAETGGLVQALSSLPDQSGLGQLLTGTDYGRWWSVSAGSVVLLALVVWLTRRGMARGQGVSRQLGVAGFALGVVATVAAAANGHNGDAAGETLGGLAIRGAHLLLVGTWIGGLVCTVVCLVALRGTGLGPARRALLGALSPAAALTFAGAVITGLILAGVQVQTVTALLSTRYGLLLIVKVGVVSAVALLALRHAYAVHRRRRNGQPRRVRTRTVVLETAGGLAALAVAVVLGGTPPARGPAFDPAPPPSASVTSVTPDDLLVRVSLRPNLPGTNIVEVTAVSRRRPAPAPVGTIRLTLSGPASKAQAFELTPGNGGTTAPQALTIEAPGTLGMEISVDRPGQAATLAGLSWTVGSPLVPRHPTVVSTQPIAPITGALAAALGLALVIGVVVAVQRARRGGPGAPLGSLADEARGTGDVMSQLGLEVAVEGPQDRRDRMEVPAGGWR
jgi:copper transport protein